MPEAAYAPVSETLAPVVGPTPEEIERRKLMAAALLKNAMGSEPIGHWTQGVSNIVQALMAGRMEKKAGEADAAAEAQAWQAIMGGLDAGIFGGGGGGEYADVPGAEAVSGDDAATMRYAGGEPPSAGTAAIYQGMLKRGMNPAQAAAFAASVQQESGGNPNANNPGEGARGIIQWRADRLRNLQNFAARQGKPWADANTQMDFALWEMQNTESGPGQMFKAAQTPEEANRALKAYIRYGDKAGPAGPAGWDSSKRLANTRRILGAMGSGETADIPGAEPVSSAPSPDVMAHIAGAGATPAAAPTPRGWNDAEPLPYSVGDELPRALTRQGSPPSAGGGTVPMPHANAAVPPAAARPISDPRVPITGATAGVPGVTPAASVPPPPLRPPYDPLTSIRAPAAPVTPPVHPLARVPQPRPAPPVAPAAPATTGAVAAPVAPRPVYAPPVKNDYATVPGLRPSVAPVRPGQLMNEPYPGVMSAQEFARAGQAAMRARAAGQQPAMAPAPGGQPSQPRRNLLQALLGRGGPQGPASPPAAPAPSAAPAGGAVAPMDGRRAQIASLLSNPRVPDALKLAALKSLTPQERDPFTLGPGQVRYDPAGNPIAAVPATPEKREKTTDANGIPRWVDTGEPVFPGDTTGGRAPPKITDVAAMRKELHGLDTYKRYAKAAPVFNSLSESFGKNTRAGDLDFVYAMATIFDPESVVREGEQILVRNTANLPDQVVNGISSLMSGTGQLDGETRRNLYDVVHGRMKQYREAADTELAGFPEMAGRWGINPADIMPNLMELKTLPGTEPAAATAGSPDNPVRPASEADIDALSSGTYYVAPDGSVRRKR